jgi:hypothetical protein
MQAVPVRPSLVLAALAAKTPVVVAAVMAIRAVMAVRAAMVMVVYFSRARTWSSCRRL